jgi:hypothetical protein
VDRKNDYRKPVEEKGYRFACLQLPDNAWDRWPVADVYLAWNFLEHLDSVEDAQQVLRMMFRYSRVAVWLLMPSFEKDLVQALHKRGFEIPWWHHRGHNAPLQKKHVKAVIPRKWHAETRPKWIIETLDPDTLLPVFGKQQIPGPISPSLVGAWEMVIRKN